MEKVSEKEVIIKNRIHGYYCDECDKFLGSQEQTEGIEFTDHYYKRLKVRACNSWWKLEGHFCEDCMELKTKKIAECLSSLGFVVD